jgi:hypothetical protein
VYPCSSVYKESREDFNDCLKQHEYPVETHASISDTFKLMLDSDDHFRKDRLLTGSPATRRWITGLRRSDGHFRRSLSELPAEPFDPKPRPSRLET